MELSQSRVADAEVVCDLMENDAPNLPAQAGGIATVEALERSAVDRDLVGRDSGVRASAPRVRDALVEAEKRHAGRRLVLDDELDIGHEAAKIVRQ